MSVLSLQQVFTRAEGFTDADPLVRISAIHHAGLRYGRLRTPEILDQLASALADDNVNVARYAAVTLAQNDDIRGVDWLLQLLTKSGDWYGGLGQSLRACTRFPFLGLLAEHIDLRSIDDVASVHSRELLGTMIHLNEGDFLDRAEREPDWRRDVLETLTTLDRIPGIRVQPGKILLHGYILSLPLESHPGFFCAPRSGGFFMHHSEAVVNSSQLAVGKEALVIANPHDPADEISTLYVLREPEEIDLDELSDLVFSADVFANACQAGPLTPGLVARRIKKNVEVLDADGSRHRESYRTKKVAAGQLALTPQSMGEQTGRTFYVPNLRVTDTQARRIVKQFAQLAGLQTGSVVSVAPKKGSQRFNTVRVQLHTAENKEKEFLANNVQKDDRFLLEPCPNCSTSGVVECTTCENGREPCSGEKRCGVCRGTGRTKNNHECTLCDSNNRTHGCEGTGEIPCIICNGAGAFACPNCSNRPGGPGVYDVAKPCTNCNGTTLHVAECDSCHPPGSGVCWICRGTGRKRNADTVCDRCQGSRKCQKCQGTGDYSAPCRSCRQTGIKTPEVKCQFCKATGKKNCRPCRKTGVRVCAICFGKKGLRCKRCKGSGKLHCGQCRSSGWTIFSVVKNSVL